MSIQRCHNIADLRRRAQRRIPAPMFHYIDGGADDEGTMRRNTEAFDDFTLVPRYLVNVEQIDTRRRVLGADLALPLVLAPTGMSCLFHHEGELAVARAAARAGVYYSLSTVATKSIEDVAAVNDGPKMYQLYILRDRGLNREFMTRAREAGYTALCLTVDVPVAGNRERDLRTGMALPPSLGLKGIFDILTSPSWLWGFLRSPGFELANVAHRAEFKEQQGSSVAQYINDQFDPTVTWEDAEQMIAEWGGPFAIKGILSADDAKRAAQIGASAVIVSNHGGRQLDGAPGALDCLREVVDAVGDQVEVILDGGIRRGTHMLKALACGATACMAGRAYLYGLAAGGEAGVTRALDLMAAELQRDMALLGACTLDDVDASCLRRSVC
ncbi:MAG: alpha-hydroxy acid oxidase [Pseudomonadota bacterium]